MKRSEIKTKKLTKSQMKAINGANGQQICPQGLCKISEDEYLTGPVGRDGYCC